MAESAEMDAFDRGMNPLDFIPEDVSGGDGSILELAPNPSNAASAGGRRVPQDWDRMRTLDAFVKQVGRPLTANSYFDQNHGLAVPKFDVHKAGVKQSTAGPSDPRPDTARPRLQTVLPLARPQSNRVVRAVQYSATENKEARPHSAAYSATSGVVGYTPASQKNASRPQSSTVNVAGGAFPSDSLGKNFPYQMGSLALNQRPFSAEAAFGVGGDLSPSSKVFGGNFSNGGAVAGEHMEMIQDQKAFSAALQMNTRDVENAEQVPSMLADMVLLPEGFENPFFPPGPEHPSATLSRGMESAAVKNRDSMFNNTYDEAGKDSTSRFTRNPKLGVAFANHKGPTSVIDSAVYNTDTRDPNRTLSPERSTSPEHGITERSKDHRPNNLTRCVKATANMPPADLPGSVHFGSRETGSAPGRARTRPHSAFMNRTELLNTVYQNSSSPSKPQEELVVGTSKAAATSSTARQRRVPVPRPDSCKFSKQRTGRVVLKPPDDVAAIDMYGNTVSGFDDRNLKLDWNVGSVLYLKQLEKLDKEGAEMRHRQKMFREHALQRMREKLATVGPVTSSYGLAQPELLTHSESSPSPKRKMPVMKGMGKHGGGGATTSVISSGKTTRSARKRSTSSTSSGSDGGGRTGEQQLSSSRPGTAGSSKGKGKNKSPSEIAKMVNEMIITPPIPLHLKRGAIKEAKSIKQERARVLADQQMLLSRERTWRGAKDQRLERNEDAESSDDDVGGSTGFFLQQRKTATKVMGLSGKKYGRTVVPGQPEDEDEIWLRKMQAEKAGTKPDINGKGKAEFFCLMPGSRGRTVLRHYDEKTGKEAEEDLPPEEAPEPAEQDFQVYADQVDEVPEDAMGDLEKFSEIQDAGMLPKAMGPKPKKAGSKTAKAKAQLASRTRGTFRL
ncbi:unnamed protein product [Amoebophrya sp. A120]|nr:unnamed protein product [Amoebophrya sp. A120]|eukprot:GSA120T00022674001.1